MFGRRWLGSGLLLLQSLAFAQGKPTAAVTAINTLPTPSLGALLWQIGSGLAVVVLLILLLAWLSKRWVAPLNRLRQPNLRLVSALSLGGRERVITVEIDNTWLVVGVTPHAINLLHTLPKPENSTTDTPSALTPPSNAFTMRLQHFLQQYRRS